MLISCLWILRCELSFSSIPIETCVNYMARSSLPVLPGEILFLSKTLSSVRFIKSKTLYVSKIIMIGLMKLSIHTMSSTIWNILCERTSRIKTKAIGVYDNKNDIDTITASLRTAEFGLELIDDLLILEYPSLHIINV